MTSKQEDMARTRNRIIAVVLAALVVVLALAVFMNVNTQRIVAQNSEYLETSTGQTARRLNDLLESSLRSVQTAANIYADLLSNDEMNAREAVQMLDFSQFDRSFFVTPEGIAYNQDGRTADVSDRPYFKDGMAGGSGVEAIDNASFDEQNVIAFYTPINHEDHIDGVMVCIYQESTLTRFMSTEFFDQTTPTYLCEPSGKLVAKAAPETDGMTNINEAFDDDDLIDISLTTIDENLAESRSFGFTFRTSDGIGNTFMSKLASFDWMVVRSFPASITNAMVADANAAGVVLVAGVIAAAVLVIIVFMLQSRRQNRELLLERQKATRIVDASTNLFNSMLSINLEDGTYVYLKSGGARKGLPTHGTYDDLREFFEKHLDMSQGDARSLMFFDIDRIKVSLPVGVPFIQQDWHAKGGEDAPWFQVSTLCLARDAQGTPTSALVAVQDITEMKRRELESRHALEDAFQAAEHASQAKSDFLNSMSHDIRTPMNSIMGLTAIAGMHVDDPDRVRECLTNITSASRHLLGLINEVLDMAKIESGSIGLSEEEFDLPETVENLITIVNPQIAAKNQHLKVELTDIQHEHVIGDPTRLQQVFVNIMGNAVKFTPVGGDISLRITELPSRIPDSGCYQFVFSDTGVGMSEEFLQRMFEPFVRANDSRTTKIEGTGLGMAIVKSVVSLMNGTIDVDSTEGEGTTFTVTVHLKLRDGADEDLSDLEGIRVLVVDDDLVACESACIMLEGIGMASDFVQSGQEGIDAVVAAEKEGDPFRCVILDWRMPEMSGIEAAKRIREATTRNVPIIILSAYDWSMIEQEAREVGVDAFISKPLFRSRLIRVMKELLSGEKKSIVDEKAMLEDLAYRGKRVLLVEDNAMAAAIAEELIELTGAEVDHAENGEVAVEMALAQPAGHYDIVLMDIQMPVMNGYESARSIREHASERPDLGDLPIIALTADAFAEDVKRAHDAGMNDHMAKPLEIETLVHMLTKWVK